MAETVHKPGSWEYNAGSLVVSHGFDTVARVSDLDDGNLIAAAPDLLHACRVAISECKGCQGRDQDCGWPVCSIARAAIAKSRGEGTMATVDHTSSPWRVEQYRGSGRGPYVDIVADDPCAPGNCAGDCTEPCSMTERIGSTEGGDGRPDVCEANARLMAASPDLLSALEHIERTACVPKHWPAFAEMYAAIAKAKGETE